ncbi:uncharacterized protein LOC116842254 isoform X1 [Odontomachus brunneus]|uniref:uncharacterized protein LOC116842254 isoform X1 n=1 Tax=Odontomachus brunneus TaxID=486640 RepID=UPI0013F1F622|nr:uncharacterized protein LOC116842254 isoform X1 [Odontomachus brunneus]
MEQPGCWPDKPGWTMQDMGRRDADNNTSYISRLLQQTLPSIKAEGAGGSTSTRRAKPDVCSNENTPNGIYEMEGQGRNRRMRRRTRSWGKGDRRGRLHSAKSTSRRNDTSESPISFPQTSRRHIVPCRSGT